jgi:hypothetical protein
VVVAKNKKVQEPITITPRGYKGERFKARKMATSDFTKMMTSSSFRGKRQIFEERNIRCIYKESLNRFSDFGTRGHPKRGHARILVVLGSCLGSH